MPSAVSLRPEVTALRDKLAEVGWSAEQFAQYARMVATRPRASEMIKDRYPAAVSTLSARQRQLFSAAAGASFDRYFCAAYAAWTLGDLEAFVGLQPKFPGEREGWTDGLALRDLLLPPTCGGREP